MPTFALHDLDATERLGRALAPLLRDGEVVELVGEVGAGKTTLTGAIARALGSIEPARSPTYTVAHAYELPGGRQLAHLDCYRQDGALDDAAWGDVEPYFEHGVAIVEWPDPIRDRLAGRPTWRVELSHVTLGARTARVTVPTGRASERLAATVATAWRAPVAT